jgi:hypothetical protein
VFIFTVVVVVVVVVVIVAAAISLRLSPETFGYTFVRDGAKLCIISDKCHAHKKVSSL